MKNLTRYLLTLMTVVFCTYSYGQINTPIIRGSLTNPALMKIRSKKADVKTEGHYFIEPEWYVGTVNFSKGEQVVGYPLRYHLEDDELEIKVEDEVKVASPKQIESFEWTLKDGTKQYFRVLDGYSLEGVPLVNKLAQVLTEGEMSAYKLYKLKKVTRDNMLTQQHPDAVKSEIVTYKTNYLAVGEELLEVKKSKKKMLAFFGSLEKEMESYIKKKKLSFGNDHELVAIISHYNQLKGSTKNQ
ncbi:hypothetical protein V6R21_26330 [Limibacter armeniacum]|uniref:hypothetical protein n=1 Tax=Limibacter armeniacum TaxID=466084 RepID=UPI002FE5AF3D